MAGRQGTLLATAVFVGSLLLASAAPADTRGLSVKLRASEAPGAPIYF